MTEEERNNGVLDKAEQMRSRGERVIIGACNSNIAMALKQSRRSIAVEILEPEELVPERLVAGSRGASNLTLLLVGLFAHPAHEDNLLDQCKDTSCKIAIHNHYSFTELVDAGIVEPGLEKILKALGVRKGNAISDTSATGGGFRSGRMLSRAISKGRHKKANR